MKGMTLKRIAEVTGGCFCLSLLDNDGNYICLDSESSKGAGEELRSMFEKALNTEAASVVTDSRKASEGSVFGAIAGERVDGNRFIPAVFEQGAVCVITERRLTCQELFGDMMACHERGMSPSPAEDSDIPAEAGTDDCAERAFGRARAHIRVENTIAALGAAAREYLRVLGIPVVGITGSVGKTSTKEMMASVLSVKLKTKKTEGNFNNELGLPLTVFSLEEGDEAAVLEMGVSHFGDMSVLADIARPGRMVITNIGTCHLEFLNDRNGVFRAKTEVLDYMEEGSYVFLNGNDDLLRNADGLKGMNTIFFGVDSSIEGVTELSAGGRVNYPGGLPHERCVTVVSVKDLGFEGSECVIATPAGDMKVKVPVPGIHNCSNAAAAAAVGLSFGMSLDEIREGIESACTISGRFRILRAHGRTVIDDCYNANPVSMKSSLRVLATAKGRRCAVLGDMGELGENEIALHEDVGAFAASCADYLAAIGPMSRAMAEAAKKAAPDLRVSWFPTVDDFIAAARGEIRDGDTVLVKASHYMKFDRIVEALT